MILKATLGLLAASILFGGWFYWRADRLASTVETLESNLENTIAARDFEHRARMRAIEEADRQRKAAERYKTIVETIWESPDAGEITPDLLRRVIRDLGMRGAEGQVPDPERGPEPDGTDSSP